MFEKEIIDLGFIKDTDNSYKLVFDNIVYYYIMQSGKIYYEYNAKSIYFGYTGNRETYRDQFIELIIESKKQQRDNKINSIFYTN